jgi:hypothetical protein
MLGYYLSVAWDAHYTGNMTARITTCQEREKYKLKLKSFNIFTLYNMGSFRDDSTFMNPKLETEFQLIQKIDALLS